MSKKFKTKKIKKKTQIIKVQSSNQQLQEDLSHQNHQIPLQSKPQNKQENTLSVLTKRFINLIKSRSGYVIDLNDAALALNVQKRRIYDITNVMEGVGYVQKIQKNVIRFLGCTDDPYLKDQTQYNQITIRQLTKKQKELDQQTKRIYEKIKNQFIKESNLNYIRISQLKQLVYEEFSLFPGFLAIKLEQGSTISSSYLTKKDQTEILLNSKKQMSIYSIQKIESLQQKQQCKNTNKQHKEIFNLSKYHQSLKQNIKHQYIFEQQIQQNNQAFKQNQDLYFKIEEHFDPISNFFKLDNEK